MQKIRVLLIHEDTLLRLSIRQILENNEDIQVVGDTGKGLEGIQRTQELQPHVVVLTLKLPDITQETLVTRLLSSPQAPTLLFISLDIQQVSPQTFSMGALGYLTSQTSPAQLISAIKKVFSSEVVIGEDIVHCSKIKPSASNLLTDREMEILILITQGKMTAEIADQLSLSHKTIHAFHNRIFEKLNVRNDVELTWRAIREGWGSMESIKIQDRGYHDPNVWL